MSFVEFHDVTKVYDSGPAAVQAANGLEFVVEQGEFALVVGPSGAGKTTVLNLLGGMERPTSGKILFDGRDLTCLRDDELTYYRRHEVGFVFQFYNLIAGLTARENVEIASKLCKHPLDVDELLDRVGLTQHARRFPAELSGGEQQRVAIARALAKNPRLILADEPTGALDYETGRLILLLLQDTCRDQGKTLIIITHNLAFAPMADRVIRIVSGRVDKVETNEHPCDAREITW